jgi:hypothetical protein
MKLFISSTCLAIIFTSCTSTSISHRSWIQTVDAAERSAYSNYTDVYQADPTILLKYKIKF